MKLQKKQYYIRCVSCPDVADHAFSLTFTTNLRSLLKEWGPTTRISPIWQLKPNIDNADAGEHEYRGANIVFLSGATPSWLDSHLSRESLGLLGNDSIWLTLGVFSLVVVSCFSDVTTELRDLCARHDIAYEIWHCPDAPETSRQSETYAGTEIERVDPAEYKAAGRRSLSKVSRSLFDHASIQADDSIGLMALELYALLAVIESRSIGQFSVLSQDCGQIEEMVALLTSDKLAPRALDNAGAALDLEPSSLQAVHAEPQDLLLTLNAALSRLSSQGLSGTSPILQTESHFWPHSLLGIGVASLALRNVASFVTGIVGAAHYSNAYKRLLELPAQWSDTDVVGGSNDMPPYLDQRTAVIGAMPGHAATLPACIDSADQSELAPTPITYYSGRDGFRNDALTMSAPLPSVSGCNSHQWNLGTITHELSHRILAGKIEGLLSGFLQRVDRIPIGGKESVRAFFAEPPTSVGDQAERLLGFTLATLHRKDIEPAEWEKRLENPGDLFRSAKERYSVAIEETLVHIFDFYHFYGGNTKLYVDYVWLSWAVQPMIARRQNEYVKRTLTALAVKHFQSDNWQDLAILEFRSILETSPLCDRLKMQPDVLEALSGSRSSVYTVHLRRMKHLITLFNLVFKSERLAGLANAESFRAPRSGGAQGTARTRKRFNYAATQTIFLSDDPGIPETRFTNPLMFLRDYSRSHKPNAAEAAWLLHMLAFNYLPTSHESSAS